MKLANSVHTPTRPSAPFQHPYGGIATRIVLSEEQARRVLSDYDRLPLEYKVYSSDFPDYTGCPLTEWYLYKFECGRVVLTVIEYKPRKMLGILEAINGMSG